MSYNLKESYGSIDELDTKDKALMVLYGRTPDILGGNIVPINVDAAGNLIIGTQLSLETDNLDIGDIIIKGTTDVAQSTTAEERIGLAAVGGIPSVGLVGQFSILTQDPRLNFTSGGLNVNGADQLYVSEAFVTADAIANARPTNGDLVIRTYKSKTIVLTNTGANDARVTIMGSVDAGTNYDVTIINDVLLQAGNTLISDETRAMTTLRIQARSAGAGLPTTINSRAYAQGT